MCAQWMVHAVRTDTILTQYVIFCIFQTCPHRDRGMHTYSTCTLQWSLLPSALSLSPSSFFLPSSSRRSPTASRKIQNGDYTAAANSGHEAKEERERRFMSRLSSSSLHACLHRICVCVCEHVITDRPPSYLYLTD